MTCPKSKLLMRKTIRGDTTRGNCGMDVHITLKMRTDLCEGATRRRRHAARSPPPAGVDNTTDRAARVFGGTHPRSADADGCEMRERPRPLETQSREREKSRKRGRRTRVGRRHAAAACAFAMAASGGMSAASRRTRPRPPRRSRPRRGRADPRRPSHASQVLPVRRFRRSVA